MRYALLVAIEEREDLSDEDAARQHAEFMAPRTRLNGRLSAGPETGCRPTQRRGW